jgi:small-conductance mechanosensitive channel
MDGLLNPVLDGSAAAEALGLGAALGLVVVLRLALPPSGKALARQPAILLGAHVAAFAADRLAPPASLAHRVLGPLALLLLLLSAGRSAVLLVLDVALGRRRERPLPRIFRDILQGLVYAGLGIATLRTAGVEISSLLATSALLTAVVGLSLQDTLGNVFAGLAIQVQPPFEVGDWIAFDAEPKHIGRVVEINWRATTLVTLDEVEIIVPNGSLAKAAIVNYTRPTKAARRSVYVAAPYSVPPAEVQRIILEAIADAPGVVRDPPPSVVTNLFGEYGIEYWVRFFTDQFHRRDGVDGGVRDRIWYALRRARVEIPYPHRTIDVHEVTEETNARELAELSADRDRALGGVDIFRVLPDDERRLLAEMAEHRLYAPGETVVRQGDESSELYVIEHGEVEVTVRRPGEARELALARLGPGKFFGEMALVTGAARQATVRAATPCQLLAVGRDALQRILERAPDLAERISVVLAERQAELDVRAAPAAEGAGGATSERRNELLGRIRKFFSL